MLANHQTIKRSAHQIAWALSICDNIAEQLAGDGAIEGFAGGDSTEALIANADLLIANDTGIRNLAIAAGTPTVGIFVPRVLFGYVPRFGRHEVAYSLDGSVPPVSSVFSLCVKLLGEREVGTASTPLPDNPTTNG